jgi:hypothetical protein
MTNNLEIIEDVLGEKHVIIREDENTFVSMPKAEYDRQQAEQSTPMVTDAPKS